ncbi:unnamed protein product [Brachionus calyciflorus]|uniref:Uncharacterized protein n=1 Tax=Brachionus calyciflorus TaxID=104777 RepID=A0A813REB1_9BILA|nr:unnamed protein product [Brachionus calyciflorus]
MSKARGARAKKQECINAEEVNLETDTKGEIKNKSDSKLIEEKIEEAPEKRVLRPKRSCSALPKVAPIAPISKPPTGRKRKNSSEKIENKKEEEKNGEENSNEDSKETSSRRASKQKIPVLFEDSPDEDQENDPQKKPPSKTSRARKPPVQRMKKSSSSSNLGSNNLSVSATATTIVNSGISYTNSISEENKSNPKSIMKSKENKMDVATDADEGKKVKRGVRIQENIAEKSEFIGVKCDKHKYSASTSTPSGLRRKPLKMPQDVSMICKPDNEQITA